MNRKIIGILGLVGLVLTGCAAPEVETEQTMMGSYSSDEIMQDNGRKIEKHFQNEGEDGVLDINAVVDIPCKFCSNGTPILKSAVHSF